MARQGLFEWDNVLLGLTKWGLIAFNVAFWVLGVVSFGVGIWLYLTNNEFATLSEGRDLLGSVFLIAVGFGVIIVGFLGIVAAVWESMVITAVFSVMVGLSLGMYLSAGIWAFSHKAGTRENIDRELTRTASQYIRNPSYAEVWDAMQEQFQCCGVTDSSDWVDERWVVTPRFAPDSCCVLEDESEREGCGEDPFRVPLPELYSQGCLEELIDYEERQYDIIGPIGIAFGVFQVFGLLLCFLFCATVRSTKDSYSTT